MAELFRVIAPRGLTVICTEENWTAHILSRHPDMQGKEEDVKTAIKSPSMGIFQDQVYKNRHVYYYLQRNRRLYTKVIVAFDDQNEGTVLTAFQVDKPKDGESLLWLGRNL